VVIGSAIRRWFQAKRPGLYRPLSLAEVDQRWQLAQLQYAHRCPAPRSSSPTEHGIAHIQRIVTDNGACYKAKDFATVLRGARHQRITPYTPRHNGKVERYHRILTEEFLYARV
jgi:transposase InsO family protein